MQHLRHNKAPPDAVKTLHNYFYTASRVPRGYLIDSDRQVRSVKCTFNKTWSSCSFDSVDGASSPYNWFSNGFSFLRPSASLCLSLWIAHFVQVCAGRDFYWLLMVHSWGTGEVGKFSVQVVLFQVYIQVYIQYIQVIFQSLTTVWRLSIGTFPIPMNASSNFKILSN